MAVTAGLSLSLGSCEKPNEPVPVAATVTITSAGANPKSVQVAPGSRVLFINNDTQEHYIHSDPHPDATDCPELNQIGILKNGEQRETGNLVNITTCGYHDHNIPTNNNFKGTIIIK
jgi:plastocyanin